MNEAMIRYFGESYDYLWNWEDNGEVVCLANNRVVAYGAYLEEVLGHLRLQGWPPFGALLLALVATGNNASYILPVSEKRAYEIADRLIEHNEHPLVKDAFKLLQVINSLPESCKSGDTRLLVLQTVFAYSHNMISAQKAKQWLPQFHAIYTGKTADGMEALTNNTDNNNTIWHFYADLRCLALQSRKFPDVNSILEKMTGVPAIEELPLPEQEQVLPTPEQPTNLVEALEANAETMQIGSLIKHLWSGLQIPIHHNLPSQQPLGGISDLTNKGDFDKLLVSEFANDDLVLLSRLANNEALYLHREVPPADKRFERIILIDSSLKNWGTPRLLAYALAIAIGKHPKTDLACKVFAVGNECLPIDYNTVDEVISSLRQIDAGLHAAPGIRQFFETADNNNTREVFYIATEEAAAHPAVKMAISNYYQHFTYTIHTTAQGIITLYKKQNKSKKLIQKMEMPLEAIWKKANQKARKPDITIAPQESVPCPILYPGTNDLKKAFQTQDGEKYAITKDETLFRIESGLADSHRVKGWGYIPVSLPVNSTHYEMGLTKGGDCMLLCFDRTTKKLSFININTGECRTKIFDDWKNSSFNEFFLSGYDFCYMNYSLCWTLDYNNDLSPMSSLPFNSEWIAVYQKRQQETTALQQALSANHRSRLKKIHRVGINREGNLVFNEVHALMITPSGAIKLITVNKERGESTHSAAFNESHNCFVFDDGSTVSLDIAGMLTLRSRALPLAMHDIISTGNASDRALHQATDAVKEDIEMIRTALTFMRAEPTVIASFQSKLEAVNYQKKFAKYKITVDVKPSIPAKAIFIPTRLSSGLGMATDYYFAGDRYFQPIETTLLSMAPQEFYTRHIKSFITHITDYAANH